MDAIDRAAERRRAAGGGLGSLLDLMRASARGIASAPGLSIAVVLAFALGIGANATVYSILDRLLLSPPAHIAEPDEVRRLLIDRAFLDRRITGTTMSLPAAEDFAASPHFSGVAAYTGARAMTVGRGDAARPAHARLVSGNFFSLLGTAPALGRFFTETEDVAGGEPVVVLGHRYWQREFGGARDVLGRAIDFGRGEWVIIGVAPESFTGIDLAPVDLWLPLRIATTPIFNAPSDNRGFQYVGVVARLAPGASVGVAEADATRLHRLGQADAIARGFWDPEARVLATPLIAARGPSPGSEVRVARWLAGVSGIVLLIACINVGNLLLGRALRQRRETAIRLALGVSRLRLVVQALADGLLLALLGGAAALAAAHWGGNVVRGVVLPGVDWSGATLTPALLLFILICAIVAGLASAAVPALQTTRADVNDALRASAGGITRSTLRTRSALSVAQAALSVLLLVGAGLFLRSLRAVGDVDLGFDGENLVFATVLPEAGSLDAEAMRRFHTEAADALSRLPLVTSAATASATPFIDAYAFPLRVPGLDSLPSSSVGGPYGIVVSDGYLETMRIPIVQGRGLNTGDGPGAPAALVVNRAFADLIWPGENALGKCVHIGPADEAVPPCAEIVGIAANARRGSINETPVPQYYMPLGQRLVARGPNVLFARVDGDMRVAAGAIRSALLAMEPALRHAEVRPLLELTQIETRPWRLGATLFTAFGIVALLVAALGMYSVLAFDVAQRMREIGLRTALGARLHDIVAMVVRRGAGMAAAGVGIGLLGAVLIADRLESLLFETSARDPLTFLGAAFVLLAVAALASALPALRAARVDPNVALRSE
jgi:predicted permease